MKPYAGSPFTQLFDQALKDKGLSTQAFAELTGINERMIRFWRSGGRLPHFNRLPVLSTMLELSLDELRITLIKSLQEKDNPSDSTTKGKVEKNSLYHALAVNDTNPLQEQTTGDLPAKVTTGKANVNQAMIALIQSLGKPPDRLNNRIQLIFQNKDVVFEKEYLDLSRDALKKAIDNGWYLEQIIQVNRNHERTLRTIFNILNYTNDENQYMLYKMKHKKSVEVSTGMLVIPGKAALICYATQDPDCIDRAIFFQANPDHEQIEVYSEHFELLKQQSEPVFRKFDHDEHQKVLEELWKSDHKAGDRIVFLKRISEVTRPAYFYDRNSNWAKSIQKYYQMTDEQLDDHLSIRKQRHDQFRDVLKKNRCRYMYCASLLEEFVNTGRCYPYYFEATEQERLDQLRETRRLVLSEESNQHFELAILSKSEEAEIANLKPSFCEVKDGIITTMEIPTGTKNDQGNLQHRWFLIEDPATTMAFHNYFSEMWDRLKDDSTGVPALIWLNRHITTLEDKLGLPRSI
jgi:transcriptional regulator with XRE-family HTH domain